MMNDDINKFYEWPIIWQLPVFIFIFFLIVYSGYLIDIKPYQHAIQESAQHEIDLRRQLESLLSKQIEIRQDIAHLASRNQQLKAWESNIIRQSELQELLTTILQHGKQNQLKVTTLNPGKAFKKNAYYAIPIEINLTGTFNQIALFISQLANMQELIAINAFSIFREGEQDEEVMNSLNSNDLLTVDLDIEVYQK